MKPPLTIESFRGKAFKFHINRGISVFSIREIIEHGIKLDFDVYLPTREMNLQRPFVWTLFQKQQLIVSIFKGIKVPPCTLIQYKESQLGEPVYKIIDGKQRLSALIDFVGNQFPIEWEVVNYYYNELNDQLKSEVYHYWVLADVGYEYWNSPISDTDKIRWFELINFSDTPQDAEHLENLKNAK